MGCEIAVVTELTVDPLNAKIMSFGWQSWTPCIVTAFGQSIPRPGDERLQDHFWRRGASWFDADMDIPGTVQADGGLLAVDTGSHEVVVFAAPDPGTIPVMRATPRGDRTLVIAADGPCTQQTYSGSLEVALTAWATAWPSTWGPDWGPDGRHWTARDDRPVEPYWCSWYAFNRAIDYDAVEATMDAIEQHRLPIKTILWDDGYFGLLGDWATSVRPDLGSLEQMAAQVRDRDFNAGLWVCPTLADVRSEVVRKYPELWVPDVDAPFGARRRVRVLDPTSPAGADYLTTVIEEITTHFHLIKTDFAWTGAVPGVRASGADPIAAYREALRLIREAAGPGATILGCGTPLLSSVHAGLTSTRVSPDIGPNWAPERGDLSQPSGQAAVVTGRARGFLKELIRPDPDVLMVGPEVERRQDIAAYVGALPEHVRGSGDRLDKLDAWGIETTRRILADGEPD